MTKQLSIPAAALLMAVSVGAALLATVVNAVAAKKPDAVLVAGAGVGLVGALGAVLAATADRQGLRGALVAAVWDQLRADVHEHVRDPDPPGTLQREPGLAAVRGS